MNSKMKSLLKEYPALSGAAKRDALDELLYFDDAETEIYNEIFGDNQRAAIRFLADASRRKKSYQILKPLVINDIDKILAIQDDKARKVAFVLLGECAAKECADKLVEALKSEKTRFVRPSIILALGNTDSPDKYLKDYIIEPGEIKHTRAESIALKKALSKTQQIKSTENIKLPKTASITFINQSAIILELEEKNIFYSKRGERLVDVSTKELENIRCYDEALYYLGSIRDLKTVSKNLNSIGCSGLNYRIEAGKFPPDLRTDIIKKISLKLSEFGYYDNPSAYSFELRVYRNGSIYALFNQKDRFSYRQKTISASINPVTAASVMQICKPYMSDTAKVLDPFCGSATMLIERKIANPCESLVGVDKSPVAIKAAIANRKASGFDISLLKTDILDFNAGVFDEVISNMPFGNRVLGHESNKILYRLFLGKLSSLLTPNGTAFLYTQEKKLLRENINKTEEFYIVKEEMFESGGLFPTLFIIKRN